MHHWIKSLFTLAAPLLLTSCLWGPGKFNSELTLRKDGSFVLDYRGEIVLQLPSEEANKVEPWRAEMAHCDGEGHAWNGPSPVMIVPEGRDDLKPSIAPDSKERACTAAELAKAKSEYEEAAAKAAVVKREQAKAAAEMFGVVGLDDASSRAFAANLLKYAGWRSATYRGNGVFDVDYHFVGSAKQDFLFPALPDNSLLLPFIAIRRRADGSVLVTAPALSGGGAGPMAARARAGALGGMNDRMMTRAQGRFTIVTEGEFLTNNSDDGPQSRPNGKEIHWDVTPATIKIPETLIRL